MESSRRRAVVAGALILTIAIAIGLGTLRLVAATREPGDALAAVRRVVSSEERIVVEVLNGSDRRGAARIATRLLRRAGFDVVYFGNAPAPVDTTELLVRRSNERPARLVGRALGAGAIRDAPDTLRRVDVTIVLGPDWSPPPGIVP